MIPNLFLISKRLSEHNDISKTVTEVEKMRQLIYLPDG